VVKKDTEEKENAGSAASWRWPQLRWTHTKIILLKYKNLAGYRFKNIFVINY